MVMMFKLSLETKHLYFIDSTKVMMMLVRCSIQLPHKIKLCFETKTFPSTFKIGRAGGSWDAEKG